MTPFHRRIPFVALLALLAGSTTPQAHAQSVSPPVAEYTERAGSSFRLGNETLFPLTVVLELRGMQVTENGDVVDTPFDSTKVRVKLSAMSFRIPPRGSYTVFYEAKSDSLPAWFSIMSSISGARTQRGINLRIELPHIVYLNQRAPLRKGDVVVRSFTYDSVSRKASVVLENRTRKLGRVRESTARARGHEDPGGSFPIFPGARRRVEIAWTGATPPEKIMLKFDEFTVEAPLNQQPAVATGTPPVP